VAEPAIVTAPAAAPEPAIVAAAAGSMGPAGPVSPG
jgi:hypothetical protein